MVPIEPHLGESIGHGALSVWLDFWELTGRFRVDIIRRIESGGDPAKMIPPDVETVVIPAVRTILVGRDSDSIHDRAGEIPVSCLRFEFIDCIHETDRLMIDKVEYEVDLVQERDMGDFAIWLVQAHRVE